MCLHSFLLFAPLLPYHAPSLTLGGPLFCFVTAVPSFLVLASVLRDLHSAHKFAYVHMLLNLVSAYK